MTEQKLKNTIHNDRWSWLWLIVATGLSCSFRLDGWERCRSPLKGGGEFHCVPFSKQQTR